MTIPQVASIVAAVASYVGLLWYLLEGHSKIDPWAKALKLTLFYRRVWVPDTVQRYGGAYSVNGVWYEAPEDLTDEGWEALKESWPFGHWRYERAQFLLWRQP